MSLGAAMSLASWDWSMNTLAPKSTTRDITGTLSGAQNHCQNYSRERNTDSQCRTKEKQQVPRASAYTKILEN
eukprot:3761527-Amphidinium_carterae.1